MDSVDERFLSALSAWLDIKGDPEAQIALERLLRSDPIALLAKHVDSLPGHLLAPLASYTTPSQRGSIDIIRQRRRVYAEVHRPDELELFPSQKRLRQLWKQLVPSNVVVEPARPQGGDDALDPAFPKMPSDDMPAQFTQSARKRRYGPVHQGELFDHPRLKRLMDEQDQEEEQIRDEEEEHEEEDGDDGEGKGAEPDEEDFEAVDAFRAAVLQRFVRGDVSTWCSGGKKRLD